MAACEPQYIAKACTRVYKHMTCIVPQDFKTTNTRNINMLTPKQRLKAHLTIPVQQPNLHKQNDTQCSAQSQTLQSQNHLALDVMLTR